MRKIIALLLLCISSSALIAGIQASVLDVKEAAFLPVALFAVAISYLLGLMNMSARKAWTLIVVSGLIVGYVEAARLHDPIVETLKAVPRFQFEFIQNTFQRQPVDTSFFELQFAEIANRSDKFFARLLTASASNKTVREVLWDIPLLLLSAWAGWWTARKKNVLAALLPSFALHSFLLYYTDKDAASLQIGAFVFILLLGIAQSQKVVEQRSEATGRAASETNSAILILSILIALGAGFMPLFSVKQAVQRIAREEGLGKTLGLDRAIAESYTISGLPRQHLVGLDPELSRETVFIVKTGELPSTDTQLITSPIPRHYWRWLTYDYYDGQSWATSPAENEEYPANETLFDFKEIRFRILHQQVEKAHPQDNRLYWSGALVRANQPIQTMWRVSPDSLNSGVDPMLAADMLGSLTAKQTYAVDSLIPLISEELLRASSTTYPKDIREHYLQLPDTVTERTRQLADELTSNLDNPYDKTKAIEAYLHTYPYSLDVPPPPPNQDIVDHFLFDLQTGYCDYYASSMIVLARASGLPSRLVIGYSSGDYDPATASYIVREANAHSWVEVYFSGIGWVEFEPTAGQTLPTLLADIPPEIASETNSTAQRTRVSFVKRGFFPTQNYSPIAFGIALSVFLSGIWFLRTQGLIRTHSTVGSIYGYVFRHGKRIIRSRTLNMTPFVFAERLKEKLSLNHPWVRPGMDELDTLTLLYQREIYSAHLISREENRQALAIWRRLFWRLLFAQIRKG